MTCKDNTTKCISAKNEGQMVQRDRSASSVCTTGAFSPVLDVLSGWISPENADILLIGITLLCAASIKRGKSIHIALGSFAIDIA